MQNAAAASDFGETQTKINRVYISQSINQLQKQSICHIHYAYNSENYFAVLDTRTAVASVGLMPIRFCSIFTCINLYHDLLS